MKASTIVILILTAIFASPAYGTEYYASSKHANRSDSNPGTSPDAPWATFDKVKSEWNSLGGGDTVHLERGSVWNLSFSSDWYISSGGSSTSSMLTLRGDDYGSGAMPILRRTGGSGDVTFMSVQRSYVTIRDIELDGGHSNYGKNTSGIIVNADGSDLSHVNILNMNIHNLGGSSSKYICGIWLESWSGDTTSDILIEGNRVSDYSAHGLNHYSVGPLVNVTWRNNIVKNSFGGGRFPSANSALQIGSGSRNCVMEYNYLEDTTTTEGNILGFGKNTTDTGVNAIRFNVIANSNTYGILFTTDQGGYRLLYDIYGNIFYNNPRSGIAIHPYDSYASGTRFNIYNNTFFNNCTDGGDETRGSMELESASDNTTVDFVNNLIYHRSHGDSVGLAVDYGFSGSFSHRNNLYWHEGGTGNNIITHEQTYTVANAKDYESTAQNTNPQLINIAQVPTTVSSTAGANPNGLGISATSPAIGKAATLTGDSGYGFDINGGARSVPWDLGAVEYGAPVPPGTEPPVIPADTEAPSVPGNVSALAVSSSQVNVSWSAASDNVGVTEYSVYRNGVDLGTTTGTSYSDSGLTESTVYAYTVLARDAAGNESLQSQSASATTAALGTLTSSTQWQNVGFASQSGLLTVEYDVIPNSAGINAVSGLSLGNASSYTDLAVIVRFYTTGQIDVRNGSVYSSDATVNYTAGAVYHFRIEVDIPGHTYSVYVKEGSGSEVLIAQDYAFRDEQNTVASLDTLAVYGSAGSQQILNFSASESSSDVVETPTGLHVVPYP